MLNNRSLKLKHNQVYIIKSIGVDDAYYSYKDLLIGTNVRYDARLDKFFFVKKKELLRFKAKINNAATGVSLFDFKLEQVNNNS